MKVKCDHDKPIINYKCKFAFNQNFVVQCSMLLSCLQYIYNSSGGYSLLLVIHLSNSLFLGYTIMVEENSNALLRQVCTSYIYTTIMVSITIFSLVSNVHSQQTRTKIHVKPPCSNPSSLSA